MNRKTIDEILTPPTNIAASAAVEEEKEWIRKADSIEELDEFIQRVGPESIAGQRAIAKRAELHFEAVKKPHWTITPTFWLAFISALAAVVACVIAWFAWRRPISPEPPSPTLQIGGSTQSPQPVATRP